MHNATCDLKAKGPLERASFVQTQRRALASSLPSPLHPSSSSSSSFTAATSLLLAVLSSRAVHRLLRPLEEESRKSRSGAKCVAIAWNLATPFGENIPKYFFLFVHLSSALLFSLAKRHLFHWSPSRQEYFCSSCTIKGNPNTRCKMEMRRTLRVKRVVAEKDIRV